MNLIEQLKKDDVPALCFLSSEAREFLFKERKRGNVLTLCACGCEAQWVRADEELSAHKVYRLKPDYKPEPEYVDLEIGFEGGFCGFYGACSDKGILLPFAFTHLHCLPSLPGFVGFFYDDLNFTARFEEVATKKRDGKNVIARFRKSERQ